jgi:hypothetical protein
MTSVLKRYSQIDSRVRFFTALEALPSINAYKLLSGARTGVVDIADVSDNVVLTAPFLKDLGRTIYVHDASVSDTIDESPVGPRVAVLRQVQIVNGAGTGGISGTAANNFGSYWIATWTSTGGTYTPAAGTAIILAKVARTG